MNLNDPDTFKFQRTSQKPFPVLFIGHGSPLNAIEQNGFVKTWHEMGETMPLPMAILCISAHWETPGTYVTAMEHPRTIHDFHGFPDALFSVQYPAPGYPPLCEEIRELVTLAKIENDTHWGLDHGSWSILMHIFPDAKIPVVQLSLDHTLSPSGHFRLAQQLSSLRRKGVLVIGSGNIVHNLKMVSWKLSDQGFDWANEANEMIKKLILDGNTGNLLNYKSLGKAVQWSVPTPEHFLPLLYILALREENDQVAFFNDALLYGSIAMTSVKFFQ